MQCSNNSIDIIACIICKSKSLCYCYCIYYTIVCQRKQNYSSTTNCIDNDTSVRIVIFDHCIFSSLPNRDCILCNSMLFAAIVV